MDYRIFIQARMSSARYPGKMLAPFNGRPLIAQVLSRFEDPELRARVVVLTSSDPTDDPLADFVTTRCGIPAFRGVLDDVVARFQGALADFPCSWFVRISGDSPLIDPALVGAMVALCDDGYDLVSNVVRRTFPPGQSVECVRCDAFRRLRSNDLTPEQREHVTKVYYDEGGAWRIRSVVSAEPARAGMRMVVDTLEDLRAVEGLVMADTRFASLAMTEAA